MATSKGLAFQRLIDEVAATADRFVDISNELHADVDPNTVVHHAGEWQAALGRLKELSVDELLAGDERVAELANEVAYVREMAGSGNFPSVLHYSDRMLTAIGQLPGDPMTPPRPRET